MARTTLILDDACMKQLKQLAHDEDSTISEIANELLADGIRRRRRRPTPGPLELPTFSMGRSKVDIADRDALEDVMS